MLSFRQLWGCRKGHGGDMLCKRLMRSVMDKKKVVIQAGPIETVAELNDTETAEAIWSALPIEGTAAT